MRVLRTRREFLQTASAALASLQTASLAPVRADERPEYRGEIIDTHTHFYDPGRPNGVPWPPQTDKLLYRRVMPAEYRMLPKPKPVSGTVVVEASPWVEDNQWILDLAANDRFIVGFVGNLALGAEDFQMNLKRFAANPIFRGVRIGADRLRMGLNRKQFIEDAKALAGRDLALDLLGGPDMLPDVRRLAEAVPRLRLVIDHVANLTIDSQEPDSAWVDGMRAAGQQSNVFCKVSGLVEGTGKTDGKAPGAVSFYRPVLDVIWDSFGEDRLVYGSNWPVSERFAPCSVVQQIVADYFTPKGQALEKVFYRNSQKCYKWREREAK